MIFLVTQYNELVALSVHEYVRLPTETLAHSHVFMSCDSALKFRDRKNLTPTTN